MTKEQKIGILEDVYERLRKAYEPLFTLAPNDLQTIGAREILNRYRQLIAEFSR